MLGVSTSRGLPWLPRLRCWGSVCCIASVEGHGGGGARERRPAGWWQERKNRRAFFDRLAKRMDLQWQPHDWKKLTRKVILDAGGGSMLNLKEFRGSVLALLQDSFPELELSARLCRKKMPQGYWKDRGNRVTFMRDVVKRLGIEAPSDWRNVTTAAVKELGGAGLLCMYNGSLSEAVRDLLPEQNAQPFHFSSVPVAYWREEKNILTFMAYLKKDMKLEALNDWESVTEKDMKEHGGAGLLRVRSRRSLLRDFLPKDTISHVKMSSGDSMIHSESGSGAGARDALSPLTGDDEALRKLLAYKSKWASRENRREFMDEVARKFNVTSPEEWRKVKGSDIVQMGGGRLLQRFPSILHLLLDTYPEQQLSELCREYVPASYWEHRENRRSFIARLAEASGVQHPLDWGKVTWRQIYTQPGCYSFMATVFSWPDALREYYEGEDGGVDWEQLVGRTVVPSSHWESPENVKALLDAVGEQFQVEKPDDWYRISNEDISSCGGSGLVRKMRLVDALRMAYPTTRWDESAASSSGKRSKQRHLYLRLQELIHASAMHAYSA